MARESTGFLVLHVLVWGNTVSHQKGTERHARDLLVKQHFMLFALRERKITTFYIWKHESKIVHATISAIIAVYHLTMY